MTSFDSIYEVFFSKMEQDSRFFEYFDLSKEESIELAKDRALFYLKESIAIILRKCGSAAKNFNSVDYEAKTFNVDLDINEIDMLASLMFEQNYKREYSKVKAFSLQFVPTTLQAFSPANDRKTLQETLNTIHEENITMLDNYMSREPGTYVDRTIDYDSYSEEEE